jgi:D-galactarolactone isomerase
MEAIRWTRRSVLKSVPLCVLAMSRTARGRQGTWKWSAGSELPKTKVPAGAADCHFHVYDTRFPVDPKAALRPADATVEDYRSFRKRIGTSRGVMVQPSTYGLDNSLLLESLAKFGPSVRGIAVVNPSVADADLKKMHQGGVRGIRFNLVQAGATTLEMVEPLAKRIANLGWHIQVNASADQIATARETWLRAACPLVFDHMGHLPAAQGTGHPAFGVICELLQKNKAWVKISGFYIDSKVGAPTYADSVKTAKAYVMEAPERLVWGSDWPHPTETEKPDDAILLDLFAGCAPDETVRNRILVGNAAKLYGF